jgi:hypothetical protein
MDIQKNSSANTSVNSTKLPASTKKINWEVYRNCNILDIGGGKFNNLKDYLKESFNIDLYIYDKYNRTTEENTTALYCHPSVIICNNVLNVIEENSIIDQITKLIQAYKVPFFISVYEGNRTGLGKTTKKDCYQRNEKTADYLKFFFTGNATVKNNLIVGGGI